jgi:uncharacterized membrane protein YkgB
MALETFDKSLISILRRLSIPLARIALFVVFFWFGILKALGLSPATGLVEMLHAQTIPFVPFHIFFIGFAVYECIIGILFLIKGAERIVIPLLFLHMITTFLPLILLPAVTWQSFLVPTIEGQYIIKNLVIIAAAVGVAANLHPLSVFQGKSKTA